MFDSILTFLTRKGISKASCSQMCRCGTWDCKKFNIRTSEWLHPGHQRSTVLRSLSWTEHNSGEKRWERQDRATLPLSKHLSWCRPLACREWSLTLVSRGGRSEDGTALIPGARKIPQFSGVMLLPSPEFAMSWPPFSELDFVLHLVQYPVKYYSWASDMQRQGYTHSFLKVVITKALHLFWTVKSWVKNDSISFSDDSISLWWQSTWQEPFFFHFQLE